MAYDCEHRPQCVNQRHHTERFYTERENRKPTLGEYVWTVITAVCAALVVVVIVLLATSCAALSGTDATKVVNTGTKIALCIEEALTDEQIAVLKQQIARIEGERQAKRDLREVIDEHPGAVSEEVEKVLK